MSFQLARHLFRATRRTTQATQIRKLSYNTRKMAQPTPASQAISETAKQEGGPSPGSTSAQMQSQVGKTRNFEQAAEEVGAKMRNDPASVTSEDARYLKSREARLTGQNQPPSDSISADAERLASANEGATKQSNPKADLDPAGQSAADRLQNFENAAEDVAPKMATDPEHVTKEEADLLHSREQRAFGQTSKGGVASQAQSLAAENEQKGNV
ncbi:Hypothetical predicted protein [Lecanosticta acicola]|uniref:SMP domain-containing protein n=1 Tax=Lecanosticta acicola TaxID=111012 RepID=A0AAI9EE79_9PEZI|nr:Hypothetical predicted protein [Lecanosticta acicola]